jgi:general secretion pathway protein G
MQTDSGNCLEIGTGNSPRLEVKTERGFSLVELLIVVAIISLIVAIAIPNLRTARQSANSASAIQSLRTVTTAEYLYKEQHGRFGTLAELGPEGTLDVSLSSGAKSSYGFAVTLSADQKSFSCIATPFEDPTVLIHFFVDDSTVIRYSIGSPADVTSTPIPR